MAHTLSDHSFEESLPEHLEFSDTFEILRPARSALQPDERFEIDESSFQIEQLADFGTPQ